MADIKRTRKLKQGYQTSPLSDVLFQVSQQLALDEKIGEMALLRLWPEIVPPEFKDKTQAVQIRRHNGKKIFQVKTIHAACAAQLSFHASTLLEALNGYVGQTGCQIDKIEIRQNGSLTN